MTPGNGWPAFPDDVQILFDTYAQQERDYVASQIATLNTGLGFCESPIEQLFLIATAKSFSASIEEVYEELPLEVIEAGRKPKLLGISLSSPVSCFCLERFKIQVDLQKEIAIGDESIRVDFLFTVKRADDIRNRNMQSHDSIWGKDLFFLVVECDGHEFHDRTKDQAARSLESQNS